MRVRAMENERLTPQRKLELVRGMNQATNVSAYAEQVGVDRTYLYELRQQMEESVLNTWSLKTVGRPSQPEPELSPDIARLQAELAESEERSKVWEVRAKVADIILDVVEKAGALKKTTSARPIFWRS